MKQALAGLSIMVVVLMLGGLFHILNVMATSQQSPVDSTAFLLVVLPACIWAFARMIFEKEG